MVGKQSDLESIKHILTLRYDPIKSSSLPKLNWRNFTPNINVSSDHIEQLIIKSIKKNIKNSYKTKLCVSLHSGIDSSLILALLRKALPDTKIQAISIKFAGSDDESERAAKFAKKFDNVSHKVVYLENYLQELPRAISITKSPFWDLHWYHVAKTSSQFSKTLVSGDGGDELFGGYTFRYNKFRKLVRKKSTPLAKVKAYLQCHERDWVPDQNKLFGRKIHFTWESVYKTLFPYFDNRLLSLSQVFLADYNGKLLYNWEPNNTKLGKHFGLKTVTPLLSKEIIAFATHLNTELKYDEKNNIGKLILRKLLEQYNYDVTHNVKQGFSVNTKNLWKSYGKEICYRYLLDGRIISRGLINKKWIVTHIDDRDIDIRYINKFLGLLAVEIWYRLFVTKEMKPEHQLIL